MSTTLPTIIASVVSPIQDTGVACVVSAIASNELAGHIALAKHLLFVAFQERRELPNGYAWRFTADQYDDLSRSIANERRCCPFTYTLEVVPHSGPIWLHITGSDSAVQAFLQSEIDAVQSEIDHSSSHDVSANVPAAPTG